MNKKLLAWLVTFAALGLAGTAAYYSVIGLSKLFAGTALAVIIMASFLEVSKLTLATLLHSYWSDFNRLSKIYFISSLVILSLITSAGIYGMLSSGYQTTINKSGITDAQIELLENKKANYNQQLTVYSEEKSSITQSVNSLRDGLSNNTIQYRDKETNQIITTTSRATRKALERQLDQAIGRQTQINSKVDSLSQNVFDIDNQIIEIKAGDEIANELGPLKYLSTLLDRPMEQIINWLLLVIIFVFDPLAIALVIAANFAFAKVRENKNPEYAIYNESDDSGGGDIPPELETVLTDQISKELDEEIMREPGVDGVLIGGGLTEEAKINPITFSPKKLTVPSEKEKMIEIVKNDPNLSSFAKNKKIRQIQNDDDITKTY